MPEGPEIRRAADQVETALLNQPLRQVTFGLSRLKVYEKVLKGSRITAVETRGKAMLTRFDNALTLYTHNQLYGRWYTGPADLQPTTRRQLRVALISDRSAALLYSASTIELLDEQQLREHPFLSRLGPDILHPDSDRDRLLQRLNLPTFRNRQLGQLLTDQSFIAGLGNYLRCEILFDSGLHPSRRARDCSADQLKQLADALFRLPRQSYRTGGITNDPATAHHLLADGASFEQARFYLFRREGLPCYRCGHPIKKRIQSGQACYLCTHCQPSDEA
ncbi:endonuclease VIII [Sedimenticola sp.]|uniref:endonuclease VIII n=1 Tax=Sedimenticola sp. TaxID=1940285 RepID=UPI003D14FAE5